MDRRPLDVALIAIYFAGFSSVLVWLIVYQLLAHRIHMPWQDKIVLLPFTLLIAIIPATIALGLWVMDNAARLAAFRGDGPVPNNPVVSRYVAAAA